MANYTVIARKHATLAAAVADGVTLGAGTPAVEVVNDGATPIYFTVDGSAPVSAADETYVVTAYGSLTVSTNVTTAPVVKLICAAAVGYHVQAAS